MYSSPQPHKYVVLPILQKEYKLQVIIWLITGVITLNQPASL